MNSPWHEDLCLCLFFSEVLPQRPLLLILSLTLGMIGSCSGSTGCFWAVSSSFSHRSLAASVLVPAAIIAWIALRSSRKLTRWCSSTIPGWLTVLHESVATYTRIWVTFVQEMLSNCLLLMQYQISNTRVLGRNGLWHVWVGLMCATLSRSQ